GAAGEVQICNRKSDLPRPRRVLSVAVLFLSARDAPPRGGGKRFLPFVDLRTPLGNSPRRPWLGSFAATRLKTYLHTKLAASSVLPDPLYDATCGYGQRGRVFVTAPFVK